MKRKINFSFLTININRITPPPPSVVVSEKKKEINFPAGFEIKTDFTDQNKLIYNKKNHFGDIVLTQPSQVHEFVIYQLLTSKQKIRGINFVVKDPVRVIIDIQIQIYWWDKLLNKKWWVRSCNQMSKIISDRMPNGICKVTLL